MRSRLLTAGPESLADHELLEMVLFLALPRKDTKPLARALLTRFGSFANVIAAPQHELCHFPEMGEASAAAVKTVQAAALRLMRAEVQGAPVLNDWERLMGYLNAQLSRERVEQFRILFLDNRNRLLADEAQARGDGEPHARLPAGGRQAGAGAARDGVDPGAQPPERGPYAVARGHRDDAGDQGGLGDDRRRGA